MITRKAIKKGESQTASKVNNEPESFWQSKSYWQWTINRPHFDLNFHYSETIGIHFSDYRDSSLVFVFIEQSLACLHCS